MNTIHFFPNFPCRMLYLEIYRATHARGIQRWMHTATMGKLSGHFTMWAKNTPKYMVKVVDLCGRYKSYMTWPIEFIGMNMTNL